MSTRRVVERRAKGAEIAWPSIVFTLQRASHTTSELVQITGVARNTVQATLNLLEVEGLATRKAEPHQGQGRGEDRWTWEPDA